MINAVSTYQGRIITRAIIGSGSSDYVHIQTNPSIGDGLCPRRYKNQGNLSNNWWLTEWRACRTGLPTGEKSQWTLGQKASCPGYPRGIIDEFFWFEFGSSWFLVAHFPGKKTSEWHPQSALDLMIDPAGWVVIEDASDELAGVLKYGLESLKREEGYPEYKNRKEFFSKY
jgi:hypothetical protein